MWKKLLLLGALGLIAAVLPGSPASAQATRTWVSGVGDDANPCSRTAPCKTFAGAMPKTAAGGEISVLDPGGFGGVTITKAITIDGGGGQVASVLVGSGNGINVVAGASDIVVLRNLRINGLTQAGSNGINYTSGAQLSVQNCVISGFSNFGINASTNGASELYVTDTYITNVSSGIGLSTTGSQLSVVIDNTRIHNTTGATGFGISTTGTGFVDTTIRNSVITSSNTAISAAGTSSVMQVDGSSILLNNIAFNAASGTVVRLSRNLIEGNSTNYGGNAASYLSDNRNRAAPTAAAPPPAQNGVTTQ